MEKTNVIVASPNVNGNIGSCEIEKTEYSTDSFHSGVVLQDSCSGKPISQYQYFDWISVFIPSIFVVIVLLIVGGVYISSYYDWEIIK